jgi:hypothetical protein
LNEFKQDYINRVSSDMNSNFFKIIPLAIVASLQLNSAAQALSFSSNHVDLNDRQISNKSNKTNSAIAQNISVGFAIGIAVKVLDRTVSVAETVAKTIPVNVPSEYREIVLPKLRQAQQSMSRAQSLARTGNNVQVAAAISTAIGFMGDAAASAKADAGSVQVITGAMVKANEALSIARSNT